MTVWLRKYIKIKKVLDFRKSVLNVKISVIFPCFHTDIFLIKIKINFFPMRYVPKCLYIESELKNVNLYNKSKVKTP